MCDNRSMEVLTTINCWSLVPHPWWQDEPADAPDAPDDPDER